MLCANCKTYLSEGACTGTSGLYNKSDDLAPAKQGLTFTLCEECWLDEEDLVDEMGTNNIPSRIETYFKNVGYDHV